MLKRLRNRRARSGWATLRPTLTWWRVRYADADRATAGLHAIQAHLPNRTIALAMAVAPLPTLWIGIAGNQHGWIVEALHRYDVQLVREFDEPLFVMETGDIPQWRRVANWPSHGAWIGLLVSGQLYVGVEGAGSVETDSAETATKNDARLLVSWPLANGQHPATWQLPTPQLGTATQLPPIPVQPLPRPLTINDAGFYLGRNGGNAVFASGRVQVWGDRRSLRDWLTQLILHQLANADAPLVVIDGHGDMVARLPMYKPFVAALKGEQLRYVNMEDDLRQQGFNPLQPLGWEDVSQTAARWERWLTQLGIWPSGMALDTHAICQQAIQDDVNNVSTLLRWFHAHPTLPHAAKLHIQRALRQVQHSVRYALWLRRPRPLLDLPNGVVFACRVNRNPVHLTMTAAILDAALHIPNVTLVLMGIPQTLLQTLSTDRLPERVGMINGMRLPHSLQGISRIADARKRQQMVTKAFGTSAAMQERLTIAPASSVVWLTEPPVQTIL